MTTSLFLTSNFTNVSFSCEADGASSYYWERQHDSIPTTASGVNTSILTITSLQPKDAGYYRCVATNASGSTESKYAKLSVNGGTYVRVYKTLNIKHESISPHNVRMYMFSLLS